MDSGPSTQRTFEESHYDTDKVTIPLGGFIVGSEALVLGPVNPTSLLIP